jgi:D-sedoheptulose 7-phosphate isomerase
MTAPVGQDAAMSSQVSTESEAIGLADPVLADPGLAEVVRAAFSRRQAPSQELVGQAGAIVAAAHAMAGRFGAGGKLLTFGVGAASADAQHVAVEFVHPVIVGKRALPAISLTSDVATVTAIAAGSGLTEVFAYQIRKLAGPADIALGIAARADCPSVRAGLLAASEAGLLTVALTAGAANISADHLLAAGSADPCVIKEVHVTIYHLLWELVHVFIEQPSALPGGTDRL